MNTYLLDTCVWSDIIRRRTPALVSKFSKLKVEQVFLSPVVMGELMVGYYKGDRTPQRKLVIDTLLTHVSRLQIDDAVADRYAQVRCELEKLGTPIGRNDTWIAAEALHHGLTLVTGNLQEFERVDKLKLENWTHHAD